MLSRNRKPARLYRDYPGSGAGDACTCRNRTSGIRGGLSPPQGIILRLHANILRQKHHAHLGGRFFGRMLCVSATKGRVVLNFQVESGEGECRKLHSPRARPPNLRLMTEKVASSCPPRFRPPLYLATAAARPWLSASSNRHGVPLAARTHRPRLYRPGT